MGFSPGNFQDTENNKLHWEAGGSRVILWNHDESKIILELSTKQAEEAYRQLEIALSALEDVSKDLISFR